MPINDFYIYVLKELKGFDEEAIEKVILLAKNDVIENDEDFIDFVNFNIEDKRIYQISQPFKLRVIKNAIDKVRKNNREIAHYVSIATGGYPQKLLQSQIGHLSPLLYKGNINNIARKTIMITGSSSITNNARLASRYLGKIFAANGYNILTSLSEGCEQSSILGCKEASGISTFFLPHSINHLSETERKIIQPELESGRCVLFSACESLEASENSTEDTYSYLTAILDCLIVPQLYTNDAVMKLVWKCLEAKKPVCFIKYKTGCGVEYNCANTLRPLGIKYISSITALQQIKEAIGGAEELI